MIAQGMRVGGRLSRPAPIRVAAEGRPVLHRNRARRASVQGLLEDLRRGGPAQGTVLAELERRFARLRSLRMKG